MRAALLALLAAGAATPVLADDFTPSLSYTGDPFAVVGGDAKSAATYVHVVTGGGSWALSDVWSLTVQGAWTAGASLSEKAVGDIAGVQGAFNNGDQVWLYQVMLTRTFKGGQVSLGRLSSGDSFGQLEPMGQFANSAFSSSGGAISTNDPGRATPPASSWGITGQAQVRAGLTLKAGAFLSDPALFAGGIERRSFNLQPGKGVLGFAEADIGVAKGWTLGMGGYADSADTTAFAGRPVSGNHGEYVFLDGPLIPGSKADGPPKLEGFLEFQGAPRSDRSLQPAFLIGGLLLNGPVHARPKDVLALGFQSGHINPRSGASGWETTVEANYRFTLNDHWGLRPDVQCVFGPGGRGGKAVVAGMQIEFSL